MGSVTRQQPFKPVPPGASSWICFSDPLRWLNKKQQTSMGSTIQNSLLSIHQGLNSFTFFRRTKLGRQESAKFSRWLRQNLFQLTEIGSAQRSRSSLGPGPCAPDAAPFKHGRAHPSGRHLVDSKAVRHLLKLFTTKGSKLGLDPARWPFRHEELLASMRATLKAVKRDRHSQ